MSEIGLFEAMYSARALRRLKPDPVPDEDHHANSGRRHPCPVGGQLPALGVRRRARRGGAAQVGSDLP